MIIFLSETVFSALPTLFRAKVWRECTICVSLFAIFTRAIVWILTTTPTFSYFTCLRLPPSSPFSSLPSLSLSSSSPLSPLIVIFAARPLRVDQSLKVLFLQNAKRTQFTYIIFHPGLCRIYLKERKKTYHQNLQFLNLVFFEGQCAEENPFKQ